MFVCLFFVRLDKVGLFLTNFKIDTKYIYCKMRDDLIVPKIKIHLHNLNLILQHPIIGDKKKFGCTLIAIVLFYSILKNTWKHISIYFSIWLFLVLIFIFIQVWFNWIGCILGTNINSKENIVCFYSFIKRCQTFQRSPKAISTPILI